MARQKLASQGILQIKKLQIAIV